MEIRFHLLDKGEDVPETGTSTVYLQIDYWNDFSFCTMFGISLHDSSGEFCPIGHTKIGFKGQLKQDSTFSKLEKIFDRLDDNYFSLGGGVDFYKNMYLVPVDFRNEVLHRLRDIVFCPQIIPTIEEERVFAVSLLRDTSLSLVKGQYSRVLEGKAELTDFNFSFEKPESERFGGISLGFDVSVGSTPSTNIHALIGRNGVGKTTILNGMIEAITDTQSTDARFFTQSLFTKSEIDSDYFSSLISVSFSAFDSFDPPHADEGSSVRTRYEYIGLKSRDGGKEHRSIEELREDTFLALLNCFREKKRTERWLNAIERLGSDENFASMRLERLEEDYTNEISPWGGEDVQERRNKYRELVLAVLERMSSGHAVVLLTITKIVAHLDEKTLVLLDEPESHLHPPLLSAFIRTLSDLLYDRNGVAIIATHSPVVLQEVPRSCVWKLYRQGLSSDCSRPDIETFAENVGLLTSEVFRLEVGRSGFMDMLIQAVNEGGSFENILESFDSQLGIEGRALLKSLTTQRDRRGVNDPPT